MHTLKDVKCQRRVSKMCSVDNGSASLSANLSSLPTSAQQHLHTTDIYRNRCMTDANDTITLRTMETSTKTNKPALRSEAWVENLVYYCYNISRLAIVTAEEVLVRDPSDDNVIPVVEELRRRLPVINANQGELGGQNDVETGEEDD
uniref:Magnesium transporter MRS2-I-like n=1 Tax=Tanacetum cinerariifolium TaxID=118510 RepID=A0A699JHY5_TANCI|nr:magnesium transporter MRS2-I-like [Tanacetum cinerariifolium]